MTQIDFNNLVEFIKAIGALATPIALSIVAFIFQRRQRTYEAVMTERIKRIGHMSPLLNRIFAYRQRVGAYLDFSPEEVLYAKREADQEFWTFEYLWSAEFKTAYHAFMSQAFEMYQKEGNKALIRAESRYYPKKATSPDWPAFKEQPVDHQQNVASYDVLQKAIARDLGFKS